jgi:hypothetical protein
VARTERRYDLIVHDTFTGGSTPEHLMSLQVVRRLREILRPGGVVAVNFAGYQRGPNAAASWVVGRTLRAVLPVVRIFRDSDPKELPDEVSNMIFFASDAPLDFTIPEGARFESDVCETTLRSLKDWEVLKEVPAGPIVTDEHNPLTRWPTRSARTRPARADAAASGSRLTACVAFTARSRWRRGSARTRWRPWGMSR